MNWNQCPICPGIRNIPSNVDKLIALSQSVLAKHQALGNSSPLKDLNIAEWTANTATADAENKRAAQLRRDAETALQNRDIAIGDNHNPLTVEYNVKSARDILLSLYKGNEKKLGEWGFQVDDSIRPPSSTQPDAPRPTA